MNPNQSLSYPGFRASVRGTDATRYPSTCLGRGPAVLRHRLDGNSRCVPVLAAMSPKGQHLCGHTGGTDLEVRLAAIATVAGSLLLPTNPRQPMEPIAP